MNNKGRHRALVFQGGGAPGAYEAGAFKSIYEHIIEKEGVHAEENMFDVVAGTSIGAINATLLVDCVIKNKTWKDSAEMLESFWNEFKAMTWADNPFFLAWWGGLRTFLGNRHISFPETARRYWSWVQLAYTPGIFGGGTPHLYVPNLELIDMTFLNLFVVPHGFSYDYQPLKQFLRKKISFPIKTYPNNGQPRLLLVSVDVKDCTTAVTFDSYASTASKCELCEEDGFGNHELVSHLVNIHSVKNIGTDRIWYSVYGRVEGNKHVVFYDGIGLEQLTAGCMIPQSVDHPSVFDYISNQDRTFWDGGLLSNIPLRELLQHHKDYWLNGNEQKKTVPDLEIYTINLFPAVEKDKQIPGHADLIRDRINDIRFHDRTVYDEKVALLVSDYVSFANVLIDLSKRLIANAYDDNNISQVDLVKKLLSIIKKKKNKKAKASDKLDEILETYVKEEEIIDKERRSEDIISRILGEEVSSFHRSGGRRNYRDLLKGTFTVTVTRIEREDDTNTISGKVGDFSSTTITELMERGRKMQNFG